MGRTARRTYELEDISIVPSRRTRSSKDVSTAWQIDAYRFAAPILSHPTDALVSPDSAIELGRLGALGVLNGEGLWARHADADAKIAALRDVAENDPDPSAATRFLQHLHSAPIDTGLLAQAVSRIRESGVTTAVRVSPQHAPELTPTLLKAGVELLVVHGTIISAEHVVAGGGEPLNLKTFIADLDVPVIAGGVHDHRTALQQVALAGDGNVRSTRHPPSLHRHDDGCLWSIAFRDAGRLDEVRRPVETLASLDGTHYACGWQCARYLPEKWIDCALSVWVKHVSPRQPRLRRQRSWQQQLQRPFRG